MHSASNFTPYLLVIQFTSDFVLVGTWIIVNLFVVSCLAEFLLHLVLITTGAG